MKLSNATSSNMTANVSDVEVAAKQTDAATGAKESEWQNTKWSQQWGYFNTIADLKSAILLRAVWDVGRGYNCDASTQVILDHISGTGKESFDDILYNLDVCSMIWGDAYAEKMRDTDSGTIINLKVLGGDLKSIYDKKGMLLRYEQLSKISGDKITFKPEDILHFSNDRLADQLHGISVIDALEETIKAENESFVDMKKLQHHQARPFILWKLKTNPRKTFTHLQQ